MKIAPSLLLLLSISSSIVSATMSGLASKKATISNAMKRHHVSKSPTASFDLDETQSKPARQIQMIIMLFHIC